jgi:hypothetical protein
MPSFASDESNQVLMEIKVMPGDPRDKECAEFFREKQEKVRKAISELQSPETLSFEHSCNEAIGAQKICACLARYSEEKIAFSTYAYYAALSNQKLAEAANVGRQVNPLPERVLKMKQECVHGSAK